MARKKPIQPMTELEIVFELEKNNYRLLALNPKTMDVYLLNLADGTERTLPFAHLPKSVKKKIRPL